MSNNNGRTTVTMNCSLSLSTLGVIVFAVFLVLKLVGVLTISWFWVFFPLWAPIALEIVIGIVIIIIALIVDHKWDKKLKKK